MPPLQPDIHASSYQLLRAAQYGFERDDVDGYNYAKDCVALAIRRLTPSRVPHPPWEHMRTRVRIIKRDGDAAMTVVQNMPGQSLAKASCLFLLSEALIQLDKLAAEMEAYEHA